MGLLALFIELLLEQYFHLIGLDLVGLFAH
jgi:hypothetical protein